MIGSQLNLSTSQKQAINRAVVAAEKGTSGEIVPMIVQRSSAIGHLPLYTGLMFFSVFLVALIEWQPWWAAVGYGLPLIAAFFICLVLGWVVTRLRSIQRWLIPDSDEEDQVWMRARSEWAFNRLQKTKNRTGILLFVSIMERKAVILADEGIATHYPPNTWQTVIDQFSSHLHKNDWVKGFEVAIATCGEILKTHLPADETNENEISDGLIIKE